MPGPLGGIHGHVCISKEGTEWEQTCTAKATAPCNALGSVPGAGALGQAVKQLERESHQVRKDHSGSYFLIYIKMKGENRHMHTCISKEQMIVSSGQHKPLLSLLRKASQDAIKL